METKTSCCRSDCFKLKKFFHDSTKPPITFSITAYESTIMNTQRKIHLAVFSRDVSEVLHHGIHKELFVCMNVSSDIDLFHENGDLIHRYFVHGQSVAALHGLEQRFALRASLERIDDEDVFVALFEPWRKVKFFVHCLVGDRIVFFQKSRREGGLPPFSDEGAAFVVRGVPP